MLERIKAIWRSDEGIELSEVALILGVVVLVGIAGYTILGTNIRDKATDIGGQIADAGAPAAP